MSEFTGTVFAIATCHEKHPERLPGYKRVVDVLNRDNCDHVTFSDTEGLGRKAPFFKALLAGLARARQLGKSHVTLLPDDAKMSHYSVNNMVGTVWNYPDATLDFMVNNPTDAVRVLSENNCSGTGRDYEAPPYLSVDGFVGMGGTMSCERWSEFLEFDARAVDQSADLAFDEIVNMFEMFGQPSVGGTVHTARSVVWHDGSVPSRCGNDYQDEMPGRHGLYPEHEHHISRGTPVDVGRTYQFNHWRLFWGLHPEYAKAHRSAERMYAIEQMAPR